MAKMIKKTANQTSAPKKYPYNTLRQSFKLGDIVKQHGGDAGSVPKALIAQELGVDQSSSGLAQLVASTKTYGLVDGLQELFLTELGREYYFPLSEDSKRAAELAFLAQPPAYEYLIKKFDGSRLPSPNIIANELGRNCGVSESWRARAASFFISAAQELGVVDAGNFLRYAAAKHTRTIATTSAGPEQHSDDFDAGDYEKAAAPATMPRSISGTAPFGMPASAKLDSVWTHTEAGGTVRVETTNPLPRELWLRLTKYVQMLEPTDGTTEGK